MIKGFIIEKYEINHRKRVCKAQKLWIKLQVYDI
jgi:hypothetical protein